jgi:para-nitrobenzyl esterase
MAAPFKRGLSSRTCIGTQKSRFGTYIKLGIASATGLLFVATHTYAQDKLGGAPIVQTDKGRVQGFYQEGVTKFLGIPYAAPPLSTNPTAPPCSSTNLRWCPPVAHAAWKGVLQTTAYAPHCPQVTVSPFDGPASNTEDCLYINVFTPNLGSNVWHGGKLPVMFWSYGGGDADGESNDYNGSKLARQGHAVVVTFNYRTNLIGFLSHPALDSEGHLFSNYGLLDNQFALKWVHNNIAAFGGDPNNVMIFGQSGGSRNTASEVLSPLAKGLFNRAWFESGAIPLITPLSLALSKGTAFAAAAGCGSGTNAQVAACLRALPIATVESFAGTAQASNSAYITGLTIDGTILPLPPIEQYQSGNFNHVPILDGDAAFEGGFFQATTEYNETPQAPLTEAQFVASMTTTFSGNAGPGGSLPAYPAGTVAAVLAHYPLSNYQSPQLQWSQEYTDANYSCTTQYVDRILASQVPLYAYEFKDQTAPDYFPPLPGLVTLAYHTSDIQYYWKGFHGGPIPPSIATSLNRKQEVLSDQLIAAVSNFAYSGNPNGRGDKPWPRYTGTNGSFFTENISSPPPVVATTYSPPISIPPATPAGLSTETDAAWAAEHQCDFWDKVLVYVPATP